MSDKAAFPSDAADKVLVRMPDGMRDRLKQAAKANSRTMNSEIVARLQDSFRGLGLDLDHGNTEDELDPAKQAELKQAAKRFVDVAFAELFDSLGYGDHPAAPKTSPAKKPKG